MALSQPMTKRDGTITIKDATGSPITCTVQYEDGDFSIEGIRYGDRAKTAYLDRGTQYGLREGDHQPVSFSFSAHLLELTDGTRKTIYDAARKTGAFAAGVSTWGTNPADPWTVTVVLAIEGSDRGGDDETVTMTYCEIEVSFAEGDPNKISVKGTSYPKDSTSAVIVA